MIGTSAPSANPAAFKELLERLAARVLDRSRLVVQLLESTLEEPRWAADSPVDLYDPICGSQVGATCPRVPLFVSSSIEDRGSHMPRREQTLTVLERTADSRGSRGSSAAGRLLLVTFVVAICAAGASAEDEEILTQGNTVILDAPEARVNGVLRSATDAGTAVPVSPGQRYRDDAIMAWARIDASSLLGVEEFGVSTVSHSILGGR